jgi:hypothetical protein
VPRLRQRACDAMGFRSRLTAAQMQLRSTQSTLLRVLARAPATALASLTRCGRAVVVTASRCVGVGFGCVLGMFPLLLGSHDAVLAAEAAATLAAAANSVR